MCLCFSPVHALNVPFLVQELRQLDLEWQSKLDAMATKACPSSSYLLIDACPCYCTRNPSISSLPTSYAMIQKEQDTADEYNALLEKFSSRFKYVVHVEGLTCVAHLFSLLLSFSLSMKPAETPCTVEQAKVLECFKQNPSRSLDCGDVMHGFLSCSQRAKMVGIYLCPSVSLYLSSICAGVSSAAWSRTCLWIVRSLARRRVVCESWKMQTAWKSIVWPCPCFFMFIFIQVLMFGYALHACI